MPDPVVEFDWLEYTVFGGMLGLSALIGIYFGFIKGGQDTVRGYLFGGKKMQLIPVSVSIVCSMISGVTLLGMPTEIYTFGCQYMASAGGFMILGLLFAYILIPIFYKLQIVSLYEYLEMRFDSSVRKVVSFIYTIYLLLYIPVVIYGPGLAMNQVSGFSVLGVSALLSAICIFYTTIGGLEAVVWTDTLQGCVMLVSSLAVAVVGTRHAGGIAAVFETASQGDRLELFNFDPDPRRRSTFWTMSIGVPFIFCSTAAINPSFTQRFLCLPTIRKAQWSSFYFSVGAYFFYFTSCYMGLVLYSYYKDCDPLLSGRISKADQILPLFVMDATRSMRGLAGVFLAGIVCAALSTMSTGMNTVAGTVYYDFLQGRLGKMSERQTSTILKVLAAVFGFACLILVTVVEKLEAILELTFSMAGVSSGVILGIIFLGIFLPQATSKGAAAGGISSLLIMGWILLGSKAAQQSGEIVYQRKPVSVEECPFNITRTLPEARFGEAFPLFEISVYYFSILSCMICMMVGIAVSFLTGPNKTEEVKRELLSPLIHRYLPEYTPVCTKEEEMTCVHQDGETG